VNSRCRAQTAQWLVDTLKSDGSKVTNDFGRDAVLLSALENSLAAPRRVMDELQENVVNRGPGRARWTNLKDGQKKAA